MEANRTSKSENTSPSDTSEVGTEASRTNASTSPASPSSTSQAGQADALVSRLSELHLPTMRTEHDAVGRQATAESWTYAEYLLELAERECDQRQEKRIERLLKSSKLPLEKSWSTLDVKRLPAKASQQLRGLLSGEFLDRRQNVLAFGPPGTGKTHALCAASQELVRSGRRVLFATTSLLVQELLAAKRDLTLKSLLKRLSWWEGLILDDLGYVQQSREEMEVLFTLLSERYERGSVLLTSNLPFSKWEQIFKDPMTTAAAIDRLVHHSVIVELNVPSYRAEAAKRRKASET